MIVGWSEAVTGYIDAAALSGPVVWKPSGLHVFLLQVAQIHRRAGVGDKHPLTGSRTGHDSDETSTR